MWGQLRVSCGKFALGLARVVWLFFCLALAACTSSPTAQSLLDDKLESSGTVSPGNKEARLSRYLAQQQGGGAFQGFNQDGNDQLLGRPETGLGKSIDNGPADITLNLVATPLAQAAKAVLGDVLKFNYSVDPKVQGVVTLQVSKPVSKLRLLSMFEAALRENGAALVDDAEEPVSLVESLSPKHSTGGQVG